MLLILAGLWVGVFVPSWFRRSEDRQLQRRSSGKIQSEISRDNLIESPGGISSIARQSFKLELSQRIFTVVAFLGFLGGIASIFVAVSQIIFIIFSITFLAIFIISVGIVRATRRKKLEVLLRASKSRAAMYSASSRAYARTAKQSLIAGNPVDTRFWEPVELPAPRQRIGELETPTLAEVVEIEERFAKNATATLDSTALDEILRRRRANG